MTPTLRDRYWILYADAVAGWWDLFPYYTPGWIIVGSAWGLGLAFVALLVTLARAIDIQTLYVLVAYLSAVLS